MKVQMDNTQLFFSRAKYILSIYIYKKNVGLSPVKTPQRHVIKSSVLVSTRVRQLQSAAFQLIG